MPRVTKATADARRAQILAAASACFARSGFDRTTMQEICAEAELSPGSVYTWFPSKRAIVKALAVQRLESFKTAVATVERDPHSAMRAYLAIVERAATRRDIGWMNIQMVADARDDRFVAGVMRSVTGDGVALLKRAFRRLMPSSRSEAEARAKLLQAAAFGIVVQSLISPPGEVASFDLAERLIAPP